jgi:hypothetical protein
MAGLLNIVFKFGADIEILKQPYASDDALSVTLSLGTHTLFPSFHTGQ